MSILDLGTRRHDCAAVLADLQKTLEDSPEWGSDGIVVLLLDKGPEGQSYNTKILSSDMRRMDAVALLESVKLDMLLAVKGLV